MFQAASETKGIQFVGDSLPEVAKEIAGLAEEAVDNVYGHLVARFEGNDVIASQVYNVKITVTLEPRK